MEQLNRQKIIKKIGTSIGIILNKEESFILGLKQNDLVNIIITKIKREENEEC